MYKRILLTALCFFMMLSFGASVLKTTLDAKAYNGLGQITEEIENDKQSLGELQNALTAIQNNKGNLQAQKDQINMETQTMLEQKMLLEQEYSLLVAEEEAITKIIDEYGVVISQTQTDKADAEALLDKQLSDFGALLVYMYMNGEDSYLKMFLKSESYSEYLAYVECMEHILDSSNRMIGDIRVTIDDISKKELDYVLANADLVTYKESLNKTQAEKEAKRKELEEKIGENGELLTLTDEELAAAKDNEEALRQQIKDLQAQISEKEQEKLRLELEATFDGNFSFPLIGCNNYRITSWFGIRTDGPFVAYEHHNGIDFACARGTAISAAAGGKVTFAGYNGAFGNVVFIEHGNGLTTVYAHCDSLIVTAGTRVTEKQAIAYVGTTGQSSGYHLHFSVLKNGVYVDPADYLPSYYLGR